MIRSAKALLLLVSVGALAFAQAPAANPQASDSKSGAYYNFTMGRIYAELAQAYGNRPEYLNKAVQYYQEALKADPNASEIFEELTELYVATNRLRDAVTTAEDTLRRNPDNVDARRMLGKIYMRMISTQDNKVNDEYLKKALEQFKAVTEKDPKDADSWVMLGRLYRVSNNSPDAEKAFNAAIAAEPDNTDALTSLAQLYSDLGDNARAVEKLKAAAEKSPNPETLIALGQTYEQMHDYKNAAEAFQKALEANPDNVRLQRVLAQTLLQADRLDDALEVFQHLSADEPRDNQLKLRIAEIYRAKRDYTKAREVLNEIKAASPDDPEVRYNEVKLLEAEGKLPEAITVMTSLVKSTEKRNYSAAEAESRVMMLQELAMLYRSNGQYPQAVEQFRLAGKLTKSPSISLQIIDTYRAAKDNESARKEADAAILEMRTQANGKNTAQLNLALATVYEKAKRPADEAAALDAAEKLNPSKEEMESIHFMRGAMFERQKKIDAADAEFRKVLQLNPENSGALNYLGYMLVDHGLRVDEATQMIKKALDAEPDNGAYLDSLGWAYYRQGKLNEAESLLVRALDRIGTDPTVHDHLADVYMKLGKTKEAISQWQSSLKEFQGFAGVDSDPEDVAKVNRKLNAALVQLAKESGK
jgi:tetratricopeptide (TPR) repeat protein